MKRGYWCYERLEAKTGGWRGGERFASGRVTGRREAIGAPSILSVMRIAVALARMLRTFDG